MDNLIFGRTWDDIQRMQQRQRPRDTYIIGTARPYPDGIYGTDPVGDGVHVRLVPTGRIVTAQAVCDYRNGVTDTL